MAHRAIPGSRIEIFDDTGHFPHVESPVRFARLLLDFIKNTDLALLRERMLARAKRSR